MKEKVILAYSGGLDTTAIIPWLKENYDYDVVCCCIDCGQGKELDGLEERAKLSAALPSFTSTTSSTSSATITSCPAYRQTPSTRTNICWVLPWHVRLIAKKLVEIARKEGAAAICHGATGKGNDQIRFELGIKALAPDLKIIAPWRMTDMWTMQSREDEIEYCQAARHSIFRSPQTPATAVTATCGTSAMRVWSSRIRPTSRTTITCWFSASPRRKLRMRREYVTMTFEKGVPTSVNGEKMKVSDIIRKLNELGGKHGIGIVDIVENRVVGMKSRGVYETPGGTILMEAHQQLEELVLDRATMEVKKDMGNKLAQIVYEGKWFTPLRDAIQAFVDVHPGICDR